MAIILLVHGGWHAGWCWDRLAPFLEQAGHRVLAPDLPGHGQDHTPISEHPWERYAPAMVEIAREQPAPVVLVGHSSGGMIISAAAREIPEKVAALVYLAAFLLPPGATPRDVMGPQSGSLLPEAMVSHPESGTTTVRPEMARAVFYHDCTADVAAWATARLQPEPIVPPAASGTGTVRPVASVPRVYIETTEDRALPIAVQRRMVADLPCAAVYTMATSHSPFLAAPARLAQILDEIAASGARPDA